MSSSKSHLEVVLSRLGGRRGLIDGAVPPVVFVAANALAGLIAPPVSCRGFTSTPRTRWPSQPRWLRVIR